MASPSEIKALIEIRVRQQISHIMTDGVAEILDLLVDSIGMELSGNTNFTGSADDTITLVLSEIGGTQRWLEVGRSVN